MNQQQDITISRSLDKSRVKQEKECFFGWQKTELTKLENGEVKRLKAEVSKLRELQLSQKDSYESEVQGMKVEISRLTKDLHDRTKTMANLSEESSQIEAQLRTEVEAQDRRQAELQVCAKVCFFFLLYSHCNHAPQFHHRHSNLSIKLLRKLFKY